MATHDNPDFANERLTFRLDSLAQTSITANDAIFVQLLGLTIREVRVLRLIDDQPGTTFVDITAMTALERTQASRIIQRLIALKLVRRKNSRSDARRFELFTTSAGQKLRAKAKNVSNALEAILLEPLTPLEVRALDGALERLAHWVHSHAYLEKIAAYSARREDGE